MSSEIAANTLNDMLTFNKIQSGKMELSVSNESAYDFVIGGIQPFQLQASDTFHA
jgi:hypothetical protein